MHKLEPWQFYVIVAISVTYALGTLVKRDKSGWWALAGLLLALAWLYIALVGVKS